MKNLRRMLLALLSLLLCIGLTACAVGGDEEENSTDPTPEATEETNELGYSVLRIGMEAAYAPNNWQEDTETETNLPISNVPGAYAEGYDIRVSTYLKEKLGVEIEIVKLSWEGLIEALNNGQIDMIIAGMADTEVRKESINFSAPYSIPSEYCIMVNADSAYAEADELADFEGASILGQKNTQYDTVIDQIPGVDHVVAVSDVANMIMRLRQETVDGLVFDESTAESYALSYPGEFKIVYFEEGKGFDKGFTGACVGLRKSDTALQEAINSALAELDIEQRQIWMDWAQENMPK